MKSSGSRKGQVRSWNPKFSMEFKICHWELCITYMVFRTLRVRRPVRPMRYSFPHFFLYLHETVWQGAETDGVEMPVHTGRLIGGWHRVILGWHRPPCTGHSPSWCARSHPKPASRPSQLSESSGKINTTILLVISGSQSTWIGQLLSLSVGCTNWMNKCDTKDGIEIEHAFLSQRQTPMIILNLYIKVSIYHISTGWIQIKVLTTLPFLFL